MANAIQNLSQTFTALPTKNKIGFAIGAAVLAALVAVSVLWSRTPDYGVLYSNVSDKDGGAIVGALAQMNIPYKMAEGGGAILVPSERVHDTRLKLASQGLPKGSVVGFELMEAPKLGITQFQEQVNYQRALEGELSRSIVSVGAIQAARVHLAIPKQSVFVRERQKPTASVLVTLHPGKTLDRAQVAGIIHLVSSSVPELSPKAVSVVDQGGTLLSQQGEPGTDLDPQQLSYVHQLEQSYIRRIMEIVEPIAGRGNVRAQVTADIDFSQSESTAEQYKPNGTPENSAIRSQQISESGSGNAQAQGVPGAASNQPGAAAAGAGATASNSRRDSTVNYEVDKTIRHVKSPVGAIKRLSAAVVINHRKSTAEDGKASYAPLPEEQMTQINALVKEAMGFNQTRGDSLNVANAAFSVEDRDAIPELPIWQQPENIALAKDLGKGLGLGLLALYVMLGIVRPLVRQLSTQPQPDAALEGGMGTIATVGDDDEEDEEEDYIPPPPPKNKRLTKLKKIAEQNPAMVASVARSWVNKDK